MTFHLFSHSAHRYFLLTVMTARFPPLCHSPLPFYKLLLYPHLRRNNITVGPSTNGIYHNSCFADKLFGYLCIISVSALLYRHSRSKQIVLFYCSFCVKFYYLRYLTISYPLSLLSISSFSITYSIFYLNHLFFKFYTSKIYVSTSLYTNENT